MYSFSTCWNSHRHTDGREMLEEIRDLGFEYAELSHGIRLSLVPGIMQAVEASLARLQTDRLDLYFVHNFDGDTPIEETLSALDDLVRQGKILYPAVSNWAAWQIATALGHCAREGLARFECIQPMYNLAKRQVEVEILPLARSEQLGVISYSPLGGGLLTGKYGVDKRPEGGRLLQQDNYITVSYTHLTLPTKA